MRTISGYRILEPIYESSSSLVYRARTASDDLPVILKVLNKPYPTPAEIIRYRQEYTITRGLKDLPGVIGTYGLEKLRNTLVIVLEDLGADSLNRIVHSKNFDLREILLISIMIANALGQIHTANVMHKDINPSNIVYNPSTRQLRIIDFGIAVPLALENPIMKNPEVLEGTLAYVSPEQTGRMNRTLDFRTDFYSLGATFYELLTGRLPFHTSDPLEMLHCHIARQPASPHLLDPEIPVAVSEIAMKLLSKNAEDRYESASGIKADLEECLRQLATAAAIVPFPLARHDAPEHFCVPQKLYGRTSQIDALMDAFDRVSKGNKEMTLVSGHPGIGKTVLVREIYKPITRQHGYFISGKYDLFRRDIPYGALVGAFRDLIRQLLTESETQLFLWRTEILASIGPNGRVVTEVIPELELMIGPQPTVPELNPLEARNRFDITFRNFTRVFCRSRHPLVVFLDDLQWADSASLAFIESVMTDPDMGYLFLVGAYRSNEVDSRHPLMLTVDRLQKEGAAVRELALPPLQQEHIVEMTCDTLRRDAAAVAPLAALVQQKTGGNPFFVNEFLKSLHTEDLVRFDRKEGTWLWDLEQIQLKDITDNVAELLAGNLRKLPLHTRQVLELAACIGTQFELTALAAVSKATSAETMAFLREAVSKGLIWPMGDGHKPMDLALPEMDEELRVEYRFAHDQIRQAAYSIIPASRRPHMHRHIGQLLLKHLAETENHGGIFAVVNQLNAGIAECKDHPERCELARLNLVAGRKAKASAAHEPALQYFKTGIELLGPRSWDEEYDLTLSLHVEAAEAAYASTEFEEMETFATHVIQRARDLPDRVKVYEVKIQGYIAEKRLTEAVSIALEVLELLGERFPKKPNKLHQVYWLMKTKMALVGKSMEELASLPEMTDPTKSSVMRILSSMASAAYYAMPQLFPIIAFKGVLLSLKYGNAPKSSLWWAVFGFILCGKLGDITRGSKFGKLALALAERPCAQTIKPRTVFVVNAFIRHWTEHVNVKLREFQETYQGAMHVGDLEMAALSAYFYCNTLFVSGAELPQLEREAAAYSDGIRKLKQGAPLCFNEIYRQVMLNLMGPSESPCDLIGQAYNEEEMLPVHEQSNDISAMHVAWYNKMYLSYLFQDFGRAFEFGKRARHSVEGVSATTGEPLFLLYYTLAGLAAFPELPKSEQKSVLKDAAAHIKKMKKWAFHAPVNHAHKYWLMEAERYRVLEKETRAMDGYERAIALAAEHGYLNEEALAYELAARFHLGTGRQQVARVYFNEARYRYQRWGATAKANCLEEKPEGLIPGSASVSPVGMVQTASLTDTTSGLWESLDLATVMKAAQAISGEIVLTKLMEKLLLMVIESAGAQVGSLILKSRGELVLEAQGTSEGRNIRVMQSTPLEASHGLSLAVVNFVARTGESVVLDDATTEASFINDPYIVETRPKSILCAPLIHQAKLSGIVYLENNLSTAAFTHGRLEMVKLLCSQAAIALENARLYEQLEQRVAERTRELEEAKDAAEKASRSKSEFLANMSHELRTPLNAVIGFSEILEDRLFGDLNEKQLSFVSNVLSSGRHLLQLINDVLDVAKVESGKMELQLAAVNVGQLMDTSLDVVRETAVRKGLSIECTVEESIAEAEVIADEVKLRQIMFNLLSNAVKFTPAGGTIGLRAAKQGNTLLVKVSDTGIGLAPEDRNRIFEAFEQVDSSLGRRQQGTGLGLTLTRKLVQLHHGSIWAESGGLGKGSTFSFTIPFSLEQEAGSRETDTI